jgi:hypothetical protein
MVPHPPYSPDLSPCDFFLFPKFKFRLKGRHFGSVDNIQKVVTDQLRALPALLPDVRTSPAVCGFPRELHWRGWCWFLVQLLIKNFTVPVALRFRHTVCVCESMYPQCKSSFRGLNCSRYGTTHAQALNKLLPSHGVTFWVKSTIFRWDDSIELQSCRCIHWLSIRGFSYLRFTAARKKNWKIK